jgi:hypothetical protein
MKNNNSIDDGFVYEWGTDINYIHAYDGNIKTRRGNKRKNWRMQEGDEKQTWFVPQEVEVLAMSVGAQQALPSSADLNSPVEEKVAISRWRPLYLYSICER